MRKCVWDSLLPDRKPSRRGRTIGSRGIVRGFWGELHQREQPASDQLPWGWRQAEWEGQGGKEGREGGHAGLPAGDGGCHTRFGNCWGDHCLDLGEIIEL